MKRCLALTLGVGLAAAALFALVTAHRSSRSPHGEIDPASRDKLDRVIERAARADAPSGEHR